MKPIGLIKFYDNISYANDFLDKGNLCFNSIEYFRLADSIEMQKKTRHDLYEGYDALIQYKDIKKITIDGRDFNVVQKPGHAKLKLTNGHQFTHLCSFSIIYEKSIIIDNEERIFDPKLFDFGDTFIFIPASNMNDFFQRINENCKINGINLDSGKIEYFNMDNISGDWGIFMKSNLFEYQEEFRIALSLNTNDRYIMNLGPLKDIAFGPTHKNNCINLVNNGVAILA